MIKAIKQLSIHAWYFITLYNKYWAVYKIYRGIPKDIVNTLAYNNMSVKVFYNICLNLVTYKLSLPLTHSFGGECFSSVLTKIIQIGPNYKIIYVYFKRCYFEIFFVEQYIYLYKWPTHSHKYLTVAVIQEYIK